MIGGLVWEDVGAPDERHQADGDFLPVHPVRTEVGGVGLGEGFKILPEGLGVFFILRQMVGTSDGKCPAEAGGFPEEFDIGVRNE